MSPTKKRTKALAGGIAGAALVLALGVTAAAHVAETGPSTSAAIVREAATVLPDVAVPLPDPGPPAESPPTTTPPTTAAPVAPAAKAAAPTTVAARRAPSPSTTAAPIVAAAPAPAPPAKLAPGQRAPYTSAGVQAAITSLHQRIPLFSPTDPQLRTFADAVCTSFDQGQTYAQVQATVQQAVSHIQGNSLSPSDAEFAVRTVLQLRCSGYLP